MLASLAGSREARRCATLREWGVGKGTRLGSAFLTPPAVSDESVTDLKARHLMRGESRTTLLPTPYLPTPSAPKEPPWATSF